MISEGKGTLLIRKIFSAIFIVVFLFLTTAQYALASTPRILSFQGRLTDSSGNLLGSGGTNYYFKFAIFDASSSGNQLWSSGSSGITLKVTQGVFNTLLGDTSVGYNALDLNFDSTDSYYLQVQVSSDNASFETLSPRQRIVSSGFAVNADTVHGGRFINATGVGQFGGLATVSYSRFGTAITTHALTTNSDALLSSMLEVDGQAFFDSSASVSVNFEVAGFASASKTFGSGLTDCDNAGNSKLLWSDTGVFSCGADQAGGGLGHRLEIKEGFTQILSDAASLSFDPTHFNLVASGSSDVAIKLDWVNGPASRSASQTITGAWTFANASNQFGNTLEIKSASISALALSSVLGEQYIDSTIARDSELHSAVTLAGLSYLSLSGQQITASKISLATQVSNTLSIASTSFTVAATGLQLSGDSLALVSGYSIPKTASISNWETFFDTPSTRITDGTNLTWSGNTLNVDDAFVLNTGDTLTGDLFGTNASFSSGTLEASVGKFSTLARDSGIITVGSSATASLNFEILGYASTSKLFGAGLNNCTTSNDKLLWDSSTGRFTCGQDVSANGGMPITVRSGATELSTRSSLSFDANSFDIAASGSVDVRISLDYTNGPASRSANQTITGFWNFNAASTQLSGLELNSNASVGGNAVVRGTLAVNGAASFGSLSGTSALFSGAWSGTSASLSTNFETVGYASISKLFGSAFQVSGTNGCSGTTDKLLWNNSSGQFSCGTDLNTGSGFSFSGIELSNDAGATFAHITSVSFAASSFNLSNSASSSFVYIDYTNGPASRSIAQTISGLWTFTGGATFSAPFELSSTASIGGNLSAKGSLTTLNQFVSTGAGSNSFSGSLDLSKGLRTTSLTGSNLTIGAYTLLGTISGNNQNLTSIGQFSALNTSLSGSFEAISYASASKYFSGGLTSCTGNNAIQWSGGLFSCSSLLQSQDATLTALAALDTTGGILVQTGTDTFAKRTFTGTANQITISNGDGISGNPTLSIPSVFSITNASLSANFEVGGIASIGGNAAFRGTGSQSFSGSLEASKGVHATGNLTTLAQLVSAGVGSNSFSGSLNVAKGLTANSYQGGGLTVCSSAGNVLRFSSGQFSCGTLADSDIPDDITLTRYLDADIPLVSIGNTASSSFERALTGTSNQITITDNGANSTAVLSIPSVFSITAASLSSNFETVGFASISGNLTAKGTLISTNTGSNSFSGSLDLSKGLRTTNLTGSSLTIGAHTLTGSITGNNFNITGLTQLSASNASATQTFEATTGKFSTLSVDSGNITISSNASVSTNIEIIGYASASKTFGSGLTSCTSNNAVQWTSTGIFSCSGSFQSQDATLTALAALDTTAGITVQTGTDTFTKRTLQGTSNQITVSNGTGVSADPTFSIPSLFSITNASLSSNFEVIGFASVSGNTSVKGTLNITGGSSFTSAALTGALTGTTASFSTNFETVGYASIGGNVTTKGSLTSTNTGSNSFSGSLDLSKGLHATSNLTTGGLVISSSAGSNSFSGSLDLSKGLRSSQLTGSTAVNTALLQANGGTLTINAFTLGGTLTGNSQNLTGLTQLTSTIASHSGAIEIGSYASISGNITTKGALTSTNTGSNSFSGSLEASKGVHATGNLATLAQFISTGVGSNSFSGSLNISKGLTANSFQGGGLTSCIGSTAALQYSGGQFSCGTIVATGGSAFSGIELSNDAGATFAHITSISFAASSFNLSTTGSSSFVYIDYTNGPASRSIAQTISGLWTFTGGATFSAPFELSSTASIGGNLALKGTITNTNTGSNSFSGSLDVTKGFSFFGEIKPDGLTCAAGEILKKTGADDWDCAADQSGGSTAWDSVGDPTLSADIIFGDTSQTITGNTNDVTAIGQDVLSIRLTNDALSDATTQNILLISNLSATGGTTERLLYLTNADNSAVTSGLLIEGTSTGAITTAVDASDAEIATALAIGANDITGTSFNVFGGSGNASSSGIFEAATGKFTTLARDSGAITISNSATESLNFEIVGYASIGGNATVKGTLAVTGLTTLSGGTTGTLSIAGSGSGLTFNGGGTNTIQSSGGTLTINAFTLGGAITGGSQNITGLNLLTSTQGSTSAAFEIGSYASIGGNLFTRGTGSSSFAGSLEVSKGVHATGNLTTGGLVISTSAGSNSFSGSLEITKGVHATGNTTTLAQFISTGAGSNSFSGSLDLSKGLRTTNLTGSSLTIGAYTSTGNITGNNFTLTGLSQLTSTIASHSGAIEIGSYASISGNITTKGTLTSTNTGSNSFSGSIEVSKGVHATGNVATLAQFISTGVGSNSFSGSLDVTKGFSFFGEIKPDGVECSNGQILKKTASNDWDCAADQTSGGTPDSLDFIDFEDALNLDADNTITGGTFALTFDHASVSANFEVVGQASASKTFGSSLTDCDDASQVLQWTASGSNAGKFSCTRGFSIQSVQVFSANGTWTRPSTVATVSVEVWGGGGAGATANNNNSQGGGGGGGYAASLVGVSGNVTVTVGTGGATTGTSGTASSFAGLATITANGGTGTSTPTGGAGGTAGSVGTINIAGARGTDGATGNGAGGGDGGGSPLGGAGGGGGAGVNAANANRNASAGTIPGGGGGGGSEANGTFGAGANGRVIVWAYNGGVGGKKSAADYAEWYETDGEAEFGDVVVMGEDTFEYTDHIGVTRNAPILRKAVAGDSVFGVISTAPELIIGDDLTRKAKNPRPIALSGRVPVNVSSENGPIRKGDLLTTSSMPGIAVRTDKAAKIIGSAMEDYNGPPDKVGKILVFINTTYSTGAKLKAVMVNQGVAMDGIPENVDISRIILAQMIQDKKKMTKETELSEIFTDRVVAGLEVITPRVITDTLVARVFEPVKDDLELRLGDGKRFVITNNDINSFSTTFSDGASQSAEPLPVVTFDNAGNAFFAGEVTAGKLNVPEINGLKGINDQIASLSHEFSALSGLAALHDLSVVELKSHLGSLSAEFGLFATAYENLGSKLSGLASTQFNFEQAIKTGNLSVLGVTSLDGALYVNTIGTNGDAISFINDTVFFGRPYFNEDTAGFAIIREGARSVDIQFSQEYLDQPIVNATISVEASDSISEELLFENNIQYLVTKKTQRGFSIKLNKNAPGNIRFSWIALAVKNPKIFNSVDLPIIEPSSPQPEDTEIPTPEEELNSQAESTPTPEITETPVAEIEVPTPSPAEEPSVPLEESESPPAPDSTEISP